MRALVFIPSLVVALNCAAQGVFDDLLSATTRPAATAPAITWNPTNNSDGLSLLTWLCISDRYTNGSVYYLPDRTTNGWHFTNAVGTAVPVFAAASGGQPDRIWFDGSNDYLKCGAYTSDIPHEVIMVFSATNVSAGYPSFWDTANAAYRQAFYRYTTTDQMRLYITSEADMTRGVTNTWIVADAIVLGASSTAYTNNVQGLTGNPGSGGISGMILGANYTPGQFGCFALTEMISFGARTKTAKIPGTNATYRANVFQYLTNKYPVVLQ